MTNLLLRWVFLVVAVVAASYVTQFLGLGFEVNTDQLGQLFIGAAVLALLNATVGNILKFLTIPLNCLTLGLFSLVINAAMLWIVTTMNYGMKLTGEGPQKFMAAFIASLLISAVSGILGNFLKDKKDKDDE